MLADHLKEGLSMESFGGVVHVSRDTIYEWLKVHKEFSDTKNAYEDAGRLLLEKIGMNGMLGKVKNFNTVAWIFIMKNRFKWRDKQPEEVNDNRTFVLAYEVKKKEKQNGQE
jgi:hypothetical protein